MRNKKDGRNAQQPYAYAGMYHKHSGELVNPILKKRQSVDESRQVHRGLAQIWSKMNESTSEKNIVKFEVTGAENVQGTVQV